MGIFSSKKKTQVGTSVARVIEDADLPDTIKTSVMRSIFANDDQIVENMLEGVVASIGVRAHRMYDYGKNGYVYGLPSSNIHNSLAGKTLVKDTIAAQVGGTVTIDYYHFGPLNNLHAGWLGLMQSHGYNPTSNELGNLSATKGVPVYLTNMVVVVTNATLAELSNGSLDQWGTSPSAGITGARKIIGINVGAISDKVPFEVDSNAVQDYVRVEYDWIVETSTTVNNITTVTKTLNTGNFTISLDAYDETADFHHVKYRRNGEVGYWLYQAGEGTHLGIDALYSEEYDGLGSFFPFAYFRFNKTSMDVVPGIGSAEYESSEKLLDYLGMDYSAVVEAVNQNPDIADVEQAMMMMAVPAVSTDPQEQRYLFDFFRGMYYSSGGTATNPLSNWIGRIMDTLGKETSQKSIIIQDARFKMNLQMRRITRHTSAGVIGPIGFHESGRAVATITQTGVDTNTGADVPWTTQEPSHYYRKQITANIYEEINVYGLSMTYYVFGEYTTTGDETDDILLIPLDHSITKEYSTMDREILYARSMHYIFNSRVVTKVKWYQTGIFKFLMILVAIVITLYSYGKTWKALVAAIAAGTVTQAMIITLVVQLLTQLVIAAAIKLFVKVVGVKVAFIVAIVAAMYGAYTAIDAGSLAGAPWAQELLQLSTGLSNAVSDSLKDSFTGLIEEYKAFELLAETKMKELEVAQKLLESDTWLTPLIIFGEKPNDFYQRTVHSGNIGTLGIEAISSYVDAALALPKLSDTI